ncbi:MAG: ABC transporter substrate-binding protein [Acidimicrobiia bacterium]
MTDQQSLARILADEYLDGLRDSDMAEVRARRGECERLETQLSYARRLLQGRIDILEDELTRRGEGRHSTASELIQRLPAILSDSPSGANQRGNRLVRYLAPEDIQRVEHDLDVVLGMSLAEVADAGTDDVESALARLRSTESGVSADRRRLHQRLDAIQAEMARRYRDGEADVDSLLTQD